MFMLTRKCWIINAAMGKELGCIDCKQPVRLQSPMEDLIIKRRAPKTPNQSPPCWGRHMCYPGTQGGSPGEATPYSWTGRKDFPTSLLRGLAF